MDTGFTFKQTTECRFLLSAKPEMATQAAKNVMCHMNVKRTAKPGHKNMMGYINVNRTGKHGNKYVKCNIHNVNSTAKPEYKNVIYHINVNTTAKI